MKKLSFLVVALFFAMTAYSQAQVSLGIKAGPNFSNINTDLSVGDNYKNRTGFHGGAYTLFKFGKVGIQPEILFSQQGSTVHVNGQDLDANFSYFNVPVIVKLYTIGGINLQLGPQFGFLSSQSGEFFDQNPDWESKAKGSDFSVAMGVGWDLPLGLSVDGRYNLGISDNSSSSYEVKNQVWQVSVGLRLFKFGK